MGHAAIAHQFQRRLRAEPPAIGHDGAPEIQRGQQSVHQPAGPGPICGAPENGFAVLITLAVKAKPVLAAHKPGQVANQRPVGNQCPFGITRGTAGVDQDRRLVRPGVDRRKGAAGTFQQRHQVFIRIFAGIGNWPDTHHTAQIRAAVARRLQSRQGTHIAQRQHCFAVLQAVFQRFGAKEHRKRHGNRPHLQNRHIGHCRLETLVHHNGHPVTAPYAQIGQGVGKAIGLGLQLCIRMEMVLSARCVCVNSYSFASIRGHRPAPGANLGHIELLWHLPSKALVQLDIGRRQGKRRAGFVSGLTDWHDRSPYDCPNVPSQKKLSQ